MSFDFDAEEVWIGEDPANARQPGVLSQGTYGAKVAVPALLTAASTGTVLRDQLLRARVASPSATRTGSGTYSPPATRSVTTATPTPHPMVVDPRTRRRRSWYAGAAASFEGLGADIVGVPLPRHGS